MSRYPLEGYREKCETDVLLGRDMRRTVRLKIPITIAGMSFGSLSARAKEALGRGATLAGTSTTTGDGGMTAMRKGLLAKTLVYQYLPSRYGMNPDDLREADAIEVVIGQGAKPGGGGMLLGQKISDRVAGDARPCPRASISGLPAVIPTGPDRMTLRSRFIEFGRSPTRRSPIYVKVGARPPYYDTALAVKSGADVIVIDGMQGGTAATQDVFIEHVGLPTLACIRSGGKGPPGAWHASQGPAHRLRRDSIGRRRRQGLGAGGGAVSIGTAALVALGDNDPQWEEEYQKLEGQRRAPMTIGMRARILPVSPHKTRFSRRVSIPYQAVGGSRIIWRS